MTVVIRRDDGATTSSGEILVGRGQMVIELSVR
jgi:hypothetical protein